MTNNQDIYSGTGYIIVRASTASSAIPLENATVIIRGVEEDNSSIAHSLLTDRDGLTPKVNLPTPPISASQSAGGGKSYSLYSIDVLLEGYYPMYFQNVPVFDGITAVQPASLVPLSEDGSASLYEREEQIFGKTVNEGVNPLL